MIVVTRHPALVEYLREQGLITEDITILTHVEDPSILTGQTVIGVLPLHLAALCDKVIEVPLALTAEDRGKELPIERVREIAGQPRTYVVREVSE